MFEMLEFEWRPRGGRPMPRQARGLRSSRPGRPGRPPRPRPGPGPRPGKAVGGLWPYRVPLIEALPFAPPPLEPGPEPWPQAEPWPQPEPGGALDDGGEEPDRELTPTLRDGVQRMPPGQRPRFTYIGTLEDAPNHARAQGPGLYYFEFTANRQRRGYSGESGLMADRLRDHRLQARVMGLNPKRIPTYVTDGPQDYDTRRAQERLFHERMFEHHPGFLTNQNLELEGEQGEGGCGAGCACMRCRRSPFRVEQELELAMEVLAVRDEADLEHFLGKMFKGIWRGVKKIAKPLGRVLKGIAKKALPFLGGALGSLIPIPGVGTALGSALGGAVSKALELEMRGMPADERQLELARRYVRIAGSAARAAGESDGSPQAVRRAVLQALRTHAPRFGQA